MLLNRDVSGTQRVELRLPPTEVPAVETTYMCTAFTFPDEIVNGDFHMIGAETIMGNPRIIHHLIVYGCPDETGSFSIIVLVRI